MDEKIAFEVHQWRFVFITVTFSWISEIISYPYPGTSSKRREHELSFDIKLDGISGFIVKFIWPTLYFAILGGKRKKIFFVMSGVLKNRFWKEYFQVFFFFFVTRGWGVRGRCDICHTFFTCTCPCVCLSVCGQNWISTCLVPFHACLYACAYDSLLMHCTPLYTTVHRCTLCCTLCFALIPQEM